MNIGICGANLMCVLVNIMLVELYVELFQIVRKTVPEKEVLVQTFGLMSEINMRLIRGPQIF